MHERNYAIDVAKIVGCLLVVMNHSTVVMTRFDGKVNAPWVASILVFFAVKIGVPLFILATGTLVLTHTRNYRYSWGHAAKFGILLLLWSYFYWLLKTPQPTWWRLDQFLLAAYQRPQAVHLWYLYMLVAFYFMLPFFSRMLENFQKRDYQWFMAGWLVLGALPLTIRNLNGPTLSGWTHLELFAGFLGYFACGQYLQRYPLKKRWAALLLLTGIAFDVAVTVLYSVRSGQVFIGLDNVMLIPSIIAAVGAYALLLDLFKNNHSQVLVHISKLTFGIYLIHYALMEPVQQLPFFANALAIKDDWSLLLIQFGIDLVVFFSAMVISQVLNWIPLVRKLVS
ncbi:acyltransferase [Lacticaseibacillus songhuajiangensis]|jgi:surface polysaccharide O-acyltransferase-like enzyme|uniref:acyltransferase n=1 Tax=Lacticaseibacillus songhuajiangensis TaxID=1296539 RepID=UPI000F793663|nr:acyltransferase family protein [Lacticaseibacillus songhuajiangensis]